MNSSPCRIAKWNPMSYHYRAWMAVETPIPSTLAANVDGRNPFMKRDLLSLIALVLVASVAVVTISSQRTLRQQMSEAEAPAARAVIQDRLTGARIDLESLIPRGSSHSTPEQLPAVVWILDMARCPDCFDNLGPWSRLETLGGHRFLLVYTGTPSGEVEGRLRSLTTTRVFQTTPERVTETLGWILPNTKLLLDEGGVAVLVDSRTSASECGWSFDAQIGALKGVNSSLAIRRIAITTSAEGETE